MLALKIIVGVFAWLASAWLLGVMLDWFVVPRQIPDDRHPDDISD